MSRAKIFTIYVLLDLAIAAGVVWCVFQWDSDFLKSRASARDPYDLRSSHGLRLQCPLHLHTGHVTGEDIYDLRTPGSGYRGRGGVVCVSKDASRSISHSGRHSVRAERCLAGGDDCPQYAIRYREVACGWLAV